MSVTTRREERDDLLTPVGRKDTQEVQPDFLNELEVVNGALTTSEDHHSLLLVTTGSHTERKSGAFECRRTCSATARERTKVAESVAKTHCSALRVSANSSTVTDMVQLLLTKREGDLPPVFDS